MNSKMLAEKIVKILDDHKAQNILLLDLSERSSIADFFVIATGTSVPHLRALSDHVVKDLKVDQMLPLSVEGYEQGQWILVDYANVVVHLFTEEGRAYYDLEGFWEKDANKRPKSTQKTVAPHDHS